MGSLLSFRKPSFMKFSITKKHPTNLLLVLMSAAALTACGGGSGGSDSAALNGDTAVAEAQQDSSTGAGQNDASDLVVGSNAETSDGDETDTPVAESGDALDPVLAGTMASATGATVSENFEGTTTSFGNALIAHKNIDLVSGQGVGGGKAIKVKYVGNSQGSERVLVNFRIPKAKVYTLNFDVKFCSGFDWARGGKLHGLGPLKPVTGGNSVPSTGWSARGMFNDGGTFKSYVYSQNMKGQYGDEVSASGVKFYAGRYHAVTYQVGLNDPATQSNGYMKVFVDGVQIVNHTGIKFRGSSADETLIQTLLFNTFHGGSDSSWAPRNADGSYKTDCAYYDNFAAYPYARVRTSLGS
jgi:hypothetical protein